MKTFPLDLTALKKVSQRLGRSSFPLQQKGRQKVNIAIIQVTVTVSGKGLNIIEPVHWRAMKQHWTTVCAESYIIGTKAPPFGNDAFFHLKKKQKKILVKT